AVSVAAWWGWCGRYDLPDSATPYAPWQVAGCVATLLVAAAVAAWRGGRWLPLAVMPASVTAAWSATASAGDDSGLWAVGAALVFLAATAAAALVGLLAGPAAGWAGVAARASDV
ncbi:MAG TPA: hypothetical protein VFY17_00460, partial [Pilimelia sp.]|nr:hypothetical protein [Pilimelia sp.]